MSDADLDAVHARMIAEAAERGARFAAVRACRHAPTDGCRCRKPRPGLLVSLCAHLKVPPADAVFVGDALSDLRAARGAGMPGALVLTGKGRASAAEVRRAGLATAGVFDDLRAFAVAEVGGG